MDYSYDQINKLIKINRQKFQGLPEETASKLERDDKLELVGNEYRKMHLKSDL